MTIGIDIDSTITSTGKKARECLKKFTSEYSSFDDLPKNMYEKFWTLYNKEIHSTCELKDGVKEAFNYFLKKGFKIVIITARNNNCNIDMEKLTKKYLRKHKLKYDKIIFNKSQKGEIARENGCDIFIDDREENLDNISQYGIECLKFGQESNKYKTFSNWHDIIEYIKTK